MAQRLAANFTAVKVGIRFWHAQVLNRRMVSYQWETLMLIKCRGSTVFKSTKKNHGLQTKVSKHVIDCTVALALGLSPQQCQSGCVSPVFVSIVLPSVLMRPRPCLGMFGLCIFISYHCLIFLPSFMLPDFTKLLSHHDTASRQNDSAWVRTYLKLSSGSIIPAWIFGAFQLGSSIAQTCANQKTWVMRKCDRNSESSPSIFFEKRLAVHHSWDTSPELNGWHPLIYTRGWSALDVG